MSKVVKTMRYQIIKPTSGDWDTLGKALREVQYATRQVLNKTIQLCWEWQGFASDYKAANDTYPQPKEVLGGSADGFYYRRMAREFPVIQTGNLSQTIQRAVRRWKTDTKDVLRGDKSIPSYKRSIPIDLHKNSIRLLRNDNRDYILRMSLLSRAGSKGMNLPSGPFEVILLVSDKTQRVILDRVIAGEYGYGSSQILEHKHKWFLNLNYQFESKETALDLNKVVGVDLGIVCPLYIAFSDSLKRYYIGGGEIEAFRKRVEARRISMLRQGKYAGDGRIGHGRAKKLEPTDTLAKKVAHFRDTVNHRYSRYVVDLAVKNGCGTIQMEDLRVIRVDNRFLAKWTYHDLQTKIEYKAEERGIAVIYVDPHYTSQRCSECGHIDRANRPAQALFTCQMCGFEANADYNAARNIATPGIDQIIAAEMKRNPSED